MEKRVFETFRKLDGFALGNMIKKDPYCDNGKVAVIKYQVTIEEIEESQEIMQKRIKELYAKEASVDRELEELKKNESFG